MTKNKTLFEQYLIDINTFDATPEQKVRRLRKSMVKNVDVLCIRLIGLSMGIMTIKVMIEQLIMQFGVYLK